MSIEKVEMYTVICDHCKENIGANQEYSCWGDSLYAQQNAMESDWIKDGDNHYCDKCVSYDEETDDMILDPKRKDKFKQ